MKSLLLLAIPFFTFSTSEASAFILHTTIVTDSIYSEDSVDIKPTPVKGKNDIYKKVANTFIYPAEAQQKRAHGRLLIYLTISTDGKIVDVAIKEGVGYGIDEEAIRTFRAIKSDWHPGLKNNQKVTTRIAFPITIGIPQ